MEIIRTLNSQAGRIWGGAKAGAENGVEDVYSSAASLRAKGSCLATAPLINSTSMFIVLGSCQAL